MRFTSFFALLLLAANLFAQSTWTRRGPLPTSESLTAGAWSGTLGVLVGERGTVLTSPDAVNWTVRARVTEQLLRDVAWTGSYFVAVGDSGKVITSPDGITWTTRATNVPYDLSAIACTSDLCVVTAEWGNAILTSADGINWITRALPSSPGTGLNSVVYVPAGAGRTAQWVAVGSHAVVSADGVSWTRYSTGVSSTLSGAVWNGTQIATNSGLGIATSSNGVTWNDVRTFYPNALVWTGSGYLGISAGAVVSGTGTAPTAWTENDLRRGTLTRIVRMGSKYVAVGQNGHIETSADATTWSSRSGATSLQLSSIVWADSQFTAVGELGTIITSSDASVWTPRASGTTFHLRRVLAAPAPGKLHRLVAVGDSGRIAVANDGITWSAQAVGGANGKNLLGIAWTGNLFVAAGAEGTLLTSADGLSWTRQTSSTTKTLYDVAFSGTLFVATGLDGTLLTSPDGVAWTTRFTGISYALNSVVWNGTAFTALGNGPGLTSTDGVTWTPLAYAPDFYVTSTRWTGSRYIAVGFRENAQGKDQTFSAVSSDGITWKEGRLDADVAGSYKFLTDVVWNGSFFLAVGSGGLVVTSPNGATSGIRARPVAPGMFSARQEGARLRIMRPAAWRGPAVATLYAPSGRRAASAAFDGRGIASFSVQGCPRGIYFIEVRGSEGRMVRPFSLTH